MPCSAYTCLDVCKNHLLVFSSFLDIWENVEWPRFLDHPVYGRRFLPLYTHVSNVSLHITFYFGFCMVACN